MKSLIVFRQIIILFLIIGVGYYASKKGIIDEKMNKGLSDFIVRITLPLLILSSFKGNYSPDMMSTIIKILIFTVLIFIFSIIISNLLNIKISRGKKSVAVFTGIFSNCGFIGFSILNIVYGQKGILYASIFNLVYNLFVWTFGIRIFVKKTDENILKKVLVNPNIISVFIGLILIVFSISIPSIFESFCTAVGGMTTPLSMIVIGSILTQVEIKKIFKDLSLYYISLLRLLIIPFLIYLILTLLKVDNLVKSIIVISEAMPAATLCPILAQSYGGNVKYASQAVFITTLVSIITIPLVITLLNI
ncbi:AEC family transporter [Clostridium tyrobutyricum]|uniref:AEC family transporter n=1 Tax=Clostridium tyrobutyricum TaxID=1519 RepID=UPI0002D862AD|nr:AEC family transporter [Clostridium tyrobutyricum]MBV4428014.1 AEC family transporter [Clostridium tyrobutyricum]MBV4443125.1 AEC family transporter [Clostridium tyrobutyricum]